MPDLTETPEQTLDAPLPVKTALVELPLAEIELVLSKNKAEGSAARTIARGIQKSGTQEKRALVRMARHVAIAESCATIVAACEAALASATVTI